MSIFDVIAHGAMGTASRADQSGVERAIAAALASSDGGTVYFPAGRYLVTSTLRIPSERRIQVAGEGYSSTLLWTCDDHLFAFDPGVRCREVTFRDFRVEANASIRVDRAAIYCGGGAERAHFANLLIMPGIRLPASGIWTADITDSSTIQNCQFWRLTGTGIRLAHGSAIYVIGGRIIGNNLVPTSIGIHLTGGQGGVQVYGTDIIGLHEGMRIEQLPGTQPNREIFLTQVMLDGCYRGLGVYDSSYVSIAGCWASACTHEKIHLDFGSPTLVIAGGTIFNAGAGGIADPTFGAHGLVVNSGTFAMNGVLIRANVNKGIWVPNPSPSDYVISGCKFDGNGQAIWANGQNYVCTSNVTRNGAKNTLLGQGYVYGINVNDNP